MADLELLVKILNASDDIILAYQPDGNIIFMNLKGQNVFGYTEADQKPEISDFLSGGKESAYYADFLNGKEIKDAFLYRKNQTCFPADVHFVTGIDFFPILAFIKDCAREDEHKKNLMQKERELSAANNVKDEFIANVTHELRTPLNGIQGHAKNMFLVETDMEKRKTLEIILNCCSTMDKLISDIMDYTKMQSMRFVLDEAPFDIRKCISAVINANSVKANEKGLSLSVFISPEVPQKAIGDERRIQQILNNLVSNAVKFTTIGYVRLELYVTGKEDNHMELSALVIDTGIGIAEDERSRLFQSFSQVDSSIGRKFGGTGLGLYVSKQLSNMMGGDITFESRKGKGSTFSVSFFLQYESQENRITDSYEELQDEMSQIDFDMGTDAIFIRGTAKNQTEIRNNLERLMLCIEMHSFSNAEQITENLRILLKGYSEIGGGIFLKLLMAIRNEDYEKSCLQYTVLFDAVSKNL